MIRLFSVFALLVAFANPSFASKKYEKLVKSVDSASIAVVSVVVNNHTKIVSSGEERASNVHVIEQISEGLKFIEDRLAKNWTVVPAAHYITKPEYRALAGKDFDLAIARIGETPMAAFGRKHRHLLKGKIPSETVKGLAELSGADYLVFVYSTWKIATGNFVPTSKAHASTHLAIYDKNGKAVLKETHRANGDKTLGGGGIVVATSDNIVEWGLAFRKSLTDAL